MFRNVAALILSIGLVTAAAAFGATFAPGDWYRELAKPAWNPPNWIFGPVWTILYLSMAVAAWLVWLRRWQAPVGAALACYGVQLVLNALWSWIFFGRHAMGLAFVEILLFDAAILATLLLFWKIRPLAAALLAPYLAWTLFASLLNFTLWRLNG